MRRAIYPGSFDPVTAGRARHDRARAVVNGQRAVSGFDFEFQIVLRNRTVEGSGSKTIALAVLTALADLGSLGQANHPISSSFPPPRS